jgi:hypothetical protein
MPPTAADVCQFLPPPDSFNGPFVILDKLMDVFVKTDIPDDFPGKLARFCCKIIYRYNFVTVLHSMHLKLKIVHYIF